MRTNDKYVNFIKVYVAANYAEKKEIERTVIKEGDFLSFAILNYAIHINEGLEKQKKVKPLEDEIKKRLDDDINNEYIGLILSGFKYFKVYKVEEFLKLAEELMKETQSDCHQIYYHLQEYFLVNKQHSSDKINYKKYNRALSHIELVLACSLKEHISVDFDNIPLNIKGNDIAIIKSRGCESQAEIIKYNLENVIEMKKYRRESFLNLIYLSPYIDLKNLPLLGCLFNEDLGIDDIMVKNMVNAVVENPMLNKEKKQYIIKNFLSSSSEEINKNSKELQEFLTAVTSQLKEEGSLNILNFSKDYENGIISKEQFHEEVRNALIAKKDENTDISLLYSWVDATEINKLRLKDKEDVDFVTSIAKNMFKPKISLTQEKLEKIELLKEELPNFSEFIDFTVGQVKLNIFHNNKMNFKPSLLLGSPGLGKTYVAKELAQILGTGFEFIDFGSTSAAFVIKGGSKQWKDAECGKILKLMNASNTINPVVLYDEIDKNNINKNYPPEVVLYQLFEPMNAKNFEDEYLGLKFDASSIVNICTANSLGTLTEALQSRMKVFEIQKLSIEQNRFLIEKMYQKTISNYSIFDSKLNEDIISSMQTLTPREIDAAIHEIIAKNIQKLSVADLMNHRQNRLNLRHFDLSNHKINKTIGF